MNTKTTVALILAAWMLVPARSAPAIELLLNENRQETGHIGFIDMQRLFKQFPETIRAKENFEEVVRQAEEQVNIRKVEIIHLRNELSQLKIERKLLDQLPATVAPTAQAAPKADSKPETKPASLAAQPPAPAAPAPASSSSTTTSPIAAPSRGAAVAAIAAPPPAPAPSTPPVAMAPVAAPIKPATHPVAALPGFGEATSDMPGESFGWKAGASTGTVPSAAQTVAKAAPVAAPAPKPEPLVINIPGVSTAPIVVQPPVAAPASTASSSIPAAVTASAKTIPSTPAAPSAVVAAAAPSIPPTSSSISAEKQASEVADMDGKIALKEKEVARKEEDFKQYQAEAEKNLLDLESRKTEILLGKIHRAIEEVARQEGVSVVVDKTNVLYGHDAVDLTDKVLKYLKSS